MSMHRLGLLTLLLAIGPLALRCAAAPIDDFSSGLGSFSTAPVVDMPELSAARTAYAKGRLDECQRQLTAAKSKVTNLPPVKLMLARLHFAHKKVDAGRALLEEVAVAEANHPEVYLLFGHLALGEGRNTDAMLHFEKALSVSQPAAWTNDQKDALQREAFLGLAAIFEKRRDWFKTQVALTQLTKFIGGDAKIRDRLGAALFMLGREQEAQEQFKTAARLDQTANKPEVSMAVMAVRQGDFEKADKWFQRALINYPQDGRVAYEMAAMLLLNDEAEEAQRLSERAAELGVDTLELSMQRGYIARQLGQFEVAERHFTSALAASPTYFEATNQLALVLAEQADQAKQDRALELATWNVRQYPDSTFANSTLGWVYYKLGRKDEALRSLQMASAQPTVRSETLYFFARVLWDTGSKDDARTMAARVKEALEQPGVIVLRPEIKRWLAETAINE